VSIDEELQILEVKLKQLRLDYEHYFLGTRPREPIAARREVDKKFVVLANNPIQNTAARFRFNSLNSRYQAFKRKWGATLREIEAGTYKRHVFKAELHERAPKREQPARAAAPGGGVDALFDAYLEAARACGQSVAGLSKQRLANVVAKQESQLRERTGCEKVKFRVVVQGGKVKLKAGVVRSG